MRDTDIVIYERDSADITFTLDESNEVITSFLASDVILLAIKMDTEGRATILKEKTGITGASVMFSLTKQDTARLFPQKYYYDITVLKGDSQQTTVLKSGNFIVANRGVKTNDKANITLNNLTQFNLLASAVEANASAASLSATSANNSATSAQESLASVQALASSTSSQINQAVSTFTSAKETVENALGNIESAKVSAIASVSSATTTAISDIQQAQAQAKIDTTLVAQYASQALTSATNASTSADTASNAAITATGSSDAAHRYANQILAIADQVVEDAQTLHTVVEETYDRIDVINARADDLEQAVANTASNVAAAQTAENNASSYASSALASKNSAATYASNASASASSASASADVLEQFIDNFVKLSVAPPFSSLNDGYILVTPNLSQL